MSQKQKIFLTVLFHCTKHSSLSIDISFWKSADFNVIIWSSLKWKDIGLSVFKKWITFIIEYCINWVSNRSPICSNFIIIYWLIKFFIRFHLIKFTLHSWSIELVVCIKMIGCRILGPYCLNRQSFDLLESRIFNILDYMVCFDTPPYIIR